MRPLSYWRTNRRRLQRMNGMSKIMFLVSKGGETLRTLKNDCRHLLWLLTSYTEQGKTISKWRHVKIPSSLNFVKHKIQMDIIAWRYSSCKCCRLGRYFWNTYSKQPPSAVLKLTNRYFLLRNWLVNGGIVNKVFLFW